MTTIEQAKAEKTRLQQDLASRLKLFTEETGLAVNSLSVNPIVTLGGVVSYYVVDVDVSL